MTYTYETLAQAIEAAPQKRLVAKLDGQQVRLALSTGGDILRMASGSKRRGFHLSQEDLLKLADVKPQFKLANLSYVERSIKTMLLHKRFLEKNRHPNLWQNLADDAANVTPDNLKLLRDFAAATPEAQTDFFKVHDFCLAHHLPTFECHKTLTLKTALANSNFRYLNYDNDFLPRIQEAVDKKQPYSLSWRGNYDYSLEFKQCETGYKGWLSQEFKGCGNGHYWLMISPSQAIFAESD